MWNDKPMIDFIIDRAFLDCTMMTHSPCTSRACRMEIPQEVREWFRRFMKSDDVEPIQFVVVPEKVR